MNTLVGYESSSEEDGANIKSAPPATASTEKESRSAPKANGRPPTVDSVLAPHLDESSATTATVEDGPMVGPTMPSQLDNDNDLSPEPSSTIRQQMSERDAIRYLTQATHPMTSIPPSPPGSPDPALNAKFKRFLDLKAKGVHFNDDLARKSTFCNPGLLATMMSRAGLDGDDQYKTSLPKGIWDPLAFPPSAYKEELLRSQQTIREQESAIKKGLSTSGKRTIEFTAGGRSGTSSRDSTPGMLNKRKRL